MSMVWIKPNFQ